MLMVGQGLESAGGLDLLVSGMTPILVTASPFWLVLMIYLLTSVLTELVTNAAVAVIMTPLVVVPGPELGIEPRAGDCRDVRCEREFCLSHWLSDQHDRACGGQLPVLGFSQD
jgi:hypothetical protein